MTKYIIVSFTKKHIHSKKFLIIEIWAYKMRFCAARFKNGKISILWYQEKRQDMSFFSGNECVNFQWLCENLQEGISLLESEIGETLDNIVINYPFSELFLQSKKVQYKRDDAEKKIQRKELENIFFSLEKLYLKKLGADIWKMYGYKNEDLQVILSRIHELQIDGVKQSKIIWKQWSKISISLLNAIIPKEKQDLLLQISNTLGKKIARIIPSEYAIAELFSDSKLLVINIWASQTTLSYKNNGEMVSTWKFPLGIHHLIQKISEKTHFPKHSILEQLNENTHHQEKDFFLSLWWESLLMSLEEILWWNMLPKKIFLTGWGAQNKFLRDFVSQYPFEKANFSVPAKPILIKEDIAPILSLMENIRLTDIENISLDMYGLIYELYLILKRENDIVSHSLKSAIKKLGYIYN